jgi:succinoglycan biosynthesis protein ExoM
MSEYMIAPPSPASILIAVATYKRNAQLEDLIESFQKLDLGQYDDNRVEIAIVDNDPESGAETCVTTLAASSRFKMDYLKETRKGVSHVRNTALEKALSENFDFIAFVDDDETVSPQWLSALLKTQSVTQAAAVFGPVNSTYDETCPDWISEWRPHAISIDRDDICTVPGGTCNVLISTQAVIEGDLRFDPRMSLTGGEDTLFFYQLMDRGYTLANSADGVVNEPIPHNRTQPGWLMKRWYRTGITDAFILNRHDTSAKSKLKAVLGGLVRIAVGGASAAGYHLISLGKLNRHTMSKLYTLCRGVGMISYSLGKTYEEYGTQKAD